VTRSTDGDGRTPGGAARDGAPDRARDPAPVPTALTLLLALTCGLAVANIYYVQPLVGPISRAYGLPLGQAGLLVTVTQLGYAAGLVLIVPLGDTAENRRLILILVGALIAALAVAVAAPTAGIFLAASAVIGLTASVVQVVVPLAGHVAPDAARGRVVGNVVSGLLFGIMLSRPLASFCANAFGVRSVFAISAGALLALLALLLARLPARRPHGLAYWRALASLGPLLARTPVLHRRAIYQSALFGSFSVFWTSVPLLLEGPRFQFTQVGIGLFALVGAGGALVSPWAGRAADAGHSRRTTLLALAGATLAFPVAIGGGLVGSWPLLVAGALVLDMAVAAHLVTGQRDIFSLGPEARGRLNGLYLALFFLGGALGSTVAGFAYARGGWTMACLAALAFPLVGLGCFAVAEPRRPVMPA
jgi:predicted MFS family arabinose efflux permease